MRGKSFLLIGGLALSMLLVLGGNPITVQAMSNPVQYNYFSDSTEVSQISLNGDSITVTGSGAVVDGSRVTIQSAGTYNLSGSLTDGQVIVDTADAEDVTLVLNGVNINNSTSAPLYVANAENIIIVLADNTQNYLSDGANYVFADAEEDEPNAALFSKDDLKIEGNGFLTVTGNYNDGIASKDDLKITGGTIIVNAVDDGIRGKDSIEIKGGNITVTAQGDGLKSDQDSDTEKGYITIETGVINVTSGGDAIQAETNVTVEDGQITIVSGGGSDSWVEEDASAKGIKAAVNITINGGTFVIDSADDAIHTNDSIVINGGTFTLASADDGIHSDTTLEINAGVINVTKSYEGLESATITINDGDFNITASDDGINVAGGNDGSGMMRGGGGFGGPGGGMPPGSNTTDTTNNGTPGDGPNAWATASGGYYMYINGGYIVVNAGGDGLDSNGSIEMSGGIVIVNGPTESMNGALDCQSFNLTGGFLVAVGSAGMSEGPSGTSTQYSLVLNFDTRLEAGTLVHIQSTDGTEILTFQAAKQFQSIVVSSPDFVAGATYTVYTGGSSSGTATDGLYSGGTYSGGTEYTSFTISSVVTQLGSGGGFGGGGHGGGGGGRGGGGGGMPPGGGTAPGN